MTDMTWKPLNQLDNFADRYRPSLISHSGLRRPSAAAERWPHIHSVEKRRAFMIIAKLLDMQQKDLQLNIHDGVLNLKCERITATKNEYHHPSERRVWRFSRFFSLPENVDQAAIKAHFKKKVLTIRLPKSKNPAQMNRAIKVN